MVSGKPLLADRWFNLCHNAGRDGKPEWPRLLAAYSETSRAYHNLDHIADCLRLLNKHANPAGDLLNLEFAIWYHDVVYDSKASDNEHKSSLLAYNFLLGTGRETKVRNLILATDHHSAPVDDDEKLLIDIDLGILAGPPESYDSYARAIRCEYSWVPAAEYARGRSKVLRRFLDRSTIYSTEAFSRTYETAARSNLHRELEELRQPQDL